MAHGRAVLVAAAAATGLLALAVSLASPASAAPPADGDWNVTGTESYANQVITLANNTTASGNLTVDAAGFLTFENVTLVLPFHSIFTVQGRLELRNSTVRGETWNLWIGGRAVFDGDTLLNATYGGPVVETANVSFTRVAWDCGGAEVTIHIRRPIDFKYNTLDNGCALGYELSPIAANTNVEIAFNNITRAGGGTGLTFGAAYHTGQVQFDIHDMLILGMNGWGIFIDVTAPNTTFLIHDSHFGNTGSAAIRADFFEGQLHVWNSSFIGVLRAARMDGLSGGTVVATLDNITVLGATASILANDMTWVIRNSSISGTNPQFECGPNGHIRIYDSADNALASATPAAGGSIEHFVTLRMSTPTWQNAVAITGTPVTMLDGSGNPSLIVDPATWSTREIVWWGMYPGPLNVDNRVLRPTIQDGGTVFNCTPASFFVSPTMGLVDVVCTDDAPPRITVLTPTFPRIQADMLIFGTARVDEAGSGLTTMEFSLDGSTFGPVTFLPGDARNFSFSRAGVADGIYRIYLRATDRTDNLRLVNVGPVTVDTVAPVLTIDPPPVIFARMNYTIAGTTEPNTTITITRTGGFTNTTNSGTAGIFSVGVLLSEGLNAYTVTARDPAGNVYSFFATTTVDTRPPLLVVLLDGQPVTTAYKLVATVRVAGSSEASAVVRVNGQLAARSAEAFTLDAPLTRGLTNLTVVASDAAGNIATWSGSAYFDDLPPSLTATVNGQAPVAGVAMLTRLGSVALAVTARDNESSVASFVVNGRSAALDGAGGYSTALALSEGENTVVVTASDAVGNTATFRVVITRDTTSPALSAWVEADGWPIVMIAGVAYTRGATVRLILVATETGTANFSGVSHPLVAGSNEFVVAFAEGRTALSLAFADLAGNTAAPVSLTVERKSAPPALTVSAPSAGASVDAEVVEVVGTADPHSTVRVNGQAVAVLATGEFRVTVPLAAGSNVLKIEAADSLGNLNETTRTVTRTTSSSTASTGAGGAAGLEIAAAFLVVGAVAGLVGGRVVASRRATASAVAPEAPIEAGPVAPPGPAPPVQKGPKGPRRQ